MWCPEVPEPELSSQSYSPEGDRPVIRCPGMGTEARKGGLLEMLDFDKCVEGHEEKFKGWLSSVQPLLNEKKTAEAWKSYPWVKCGPPPFTPLKKPLSRCRVGLVTTAGLFLEGQEPFQTAWEGDFSYRELPRDVNPDKIMIKHMAYDPKYAKEDLNVVFPLEIFKNLEKEGKIGSLSSAFYSFMGMITNLSRLRPAIAEVTNKMLADGVDACFLFPV